MGPETEPQSQTTPAPRSSSTGLIVAGVVVGVLAVAGAGVTVAMPWIVDQVASRMTIEIESASVGPAGGIKELFGGLPDALEVTVDVIVTNQNIIDIELHDIEIKGYVNETPIAKGAPELPSSPLLLPAGESDEIRMKTRVPIQAATAIPMDIIRKGTIKLRVEGTATGEALGKRVKRDFTVEGVNLRLQPTLKF
mgnify:CR=1 FL=1